MVEDDFKVDIVIEYVRISLKVHSEEEIMVALELEAIGVESDCDWSVSRAHLLDLNVFHWLALLFLRSTVN